MRVQSHAGTFGASWANDSCRWNVHWRYRYVVKKIIWWSHTPIPDDELHAALWQFADLHHRWASFICVKWSESWNTGIWPANEMNIRPDSTSTDWLADSLLVHFSPDKWQLTSSWQLWPGWTGVGNNSVLGAVLTGLSWDADEVLMSAWNVIIGPGLHAWTSQSLNNLEAFLTCRQWQTGNNS